MQSWQRLVALCLKANEPTCVWGDPGIGKTTFGVALGKAAGWHTEVVISSLREPSDFLGLPVVTEKGVHMAPPKWALNLAKAGGGLLIFDEITTAPPAVQSALLRVVLEKVVGDLELPKDTRILALANVASQAGGWDLSLPLANRFCHIQAAAPKADDWTSGVLEGWPIPNVETLMAPNKPTVGTANAMVAGFLTARPELLMQLPKEGSKDAESWASPRSWDMSRRVLAFALANGWGKDLIAMVMGGCIGTGIGLEFATWATKLDLPNPKEILKDPRKFKAPDRTDLAIVILNSMVSTAIDEAQEGDKNQIWSAAWEIMEKVAEAGMVDAVVPPGRVLAKALSAQGRPSIGPILKKRLNEILRD